MSNPDFIEAAPDVPLENRHEPYNIHRISPEKQRINKLGSSTEIKSIEQINEDMRLLNEATALSESIPDVYRFSMDNVKILNYILHEIDKSKESIYRQNEFSKRMREYGFSLDKQLDIIQRIVKETKHIHGPLSSVEQPLPQVLESVSEQPLPQVLESVSEQPLMSKLSTKPISRLIHLGGKRKLTRRRKSARRGKSARHRKSARRGKSARHRKSARRG